MKVSGEDAARGALRPGRYGRDGGWGGSEVALGGFERILGALRDFGGLAQEVSLPVSSTSQPCASLSVI